eukprot:TRINITY_DN18035_c6_g1_i1.p1 TRINITY_DN18035_c6_g1~~TRINITY_DN18035_c6_g1_i1.p1  ORF type:complete len:352 (+),score=58.21 TRINITY_DN18035_c6_g1_i1:62-1057(+)
MQCGLTLTSPLRSGGLTVSMGLISGFQKRGRSVGFLRVPRGEGVIQVEDAAVDKDTVIIREKVLTNHLQYKEICPSGGVEGVASAYEKMRLNNDVTILSLPGTAAREGFSDIVQNVKSLNIMVCSEASEEPFILNSNFYKKGLDGAILNKNGGLKDYNYTVFGSVPHTAALQTLTILDLQEIFKMDERTKISDSHPITTCLGVSSAIDAFEASAALAEHPFPLFVVPGSRFDVISSILSVVDRCVGVVKPSFLFTGAVSQWPSSLVKRLEPHTVFVHRTATVSQVLSEIAKWNAVGFPHRFDDDRKIQEAVRVVENGVDFDLLESAMQGVL